MATMQDLVRDWRRWSQAERIIAVIAALVAVAIPTAVAINLHLS